MFLLAQYLNEDTYIDFKPIKMFMSRELAEKEAFYRVQKDMDKCKQKNIQCNKRIVTKFHSLLQLPMSTIQFTHDEGISEYVFCVIGVPDTPISELRKSLKQNENCYFRLTKNKHFYSFLEIFGFVYIFQIIILLLVCTLFYLH